MTDVQTAYEMDNLDIPLKLSQTVLMCVTVTHPSKTWSSVKEAALYQEWWHCTEMWSKATGSNAYKGSRYFTITDCPNVTILLMHLFEDTTNSMTAALTYKASAAFRHMLDEFEHDDRYGVTVIDTNQFTYKGGHNYP